MLPISCLCTCLQPYWWNLCQFWIVQVSEIIDYNISEMDDDLFTMV